ncbi:patatin-like phospholipase family protein, partial [Shewanella sp. SR41-2]|nr:patatin-like phospholipase family protein [Shewanella sp. SR41-2]
CPSAEFVTSLPFSKIPDRSDFVEMKPAQRLQYWQQVFVESEKLAEHFKDFYQQQNIHSIKSIEPLLA